MKIVISNILSIQNPNSSVLTWCNKNLIFKNPDYNTKIKLGKWTGATPKYITLFNYCPPESMLYLPSTCYEYIEQFVGEGDEVIDCRVEVNANIVSKMKLRDYQEYAMIPFATKFHHHDTGLLIAFPGLGKTNMALEIAARLKQKTLWLTHTRDLCLQAQKRCHETLFCKTSLITDGNVDTSGDIVIATVQTLVKNLDKIPQNTFGLVVIDECFPAGTKISTKGGYKNIEDIHIGDYVYSYNHTLNKIELKKIDYVFKQTSDSLINIKLSNNSNIICTPNHPIYTNRGYIQANELKKGDICYEMQVLWERGKSRRFYSKSVGKQDKILSPNREHLLFTKMCTSSLCKNIKRLCARGHSDEPYEKSQPNEQPKNKRKTISNIKSNGLETTGARWKWSWFNRAPKNFTKRNKGVLCKSNTRVSCSNKNGCSFRLSNLLQIGYWFRRFENWYRSGWRVTQIFKSSRKRYQETRVLRELRVEDITIQKRGDTKQSRKSDRRIEVYNLSVSGNNNYFANNILVHNCHHTFISGESVGMFQQCIEYFAAKHKMGMSGTLSRSDSLEVCIPYLIGKVAYETKEEDKDYVVYIDNKEFFRFDKSKYLTPTKVNFIKTNFSISTTDKYGIVQYKDVFDKSGMTISFAKLMNEICSDKERNQQVIDVANSISGSTIILSDRVSQLEYLHEHIPNSVLITGNTKKKDREQALKDVYDGKIKTLCASYKICKEGVDCPILANLILASPIKDNGTVEQCVGRIRRVYDGKTVANVYDFVDSEVSTLQRFYYKRRNIYKKRSWL